MKQARFSLLAAVLAAGCGSVRMDAVRRDPGTRERRLYTRSDPDARASALESAGKEGCREARQGRLTMSLCPEPENVKAGAAALLRFQAEESSADGAKPLSGAGIALDFHHWGTRDVRGIALPAPEVSRVVETAPGNYKATAVFPAEGKWTVQAVVTPPGGDALRLDFELTADPAAVPAR